MKLKFFVVGSCFCGYMFKEKLMGDLSNGNLEMVYQHQHDSFISMMTKAADVDLKGATSKYQWDFDHFAASVFQKDILQRIASLKPDYIVFDTYADAFCPIIETEPDVYITDNYYIHLSSIRSQLNTGRVISADSPEREKLFTKYVVLFFDAVRNILPDIKLILVRTKASEELYDVQNEKRSVFSMRIK